MIDKFLEEYSIDLASLSRLKHRLFIVGRFNQRNKGAFPDLYLFKNATRSGPDPYMNNFDEVLPLRYESFVQALRPAIAERVVEGKIPTVVQVVPQGDDASEGRSVIDNFNFFFQRAVANSDQEAFRGRQPSIPSALLTGSSKDNGKTIFKLIRKDLHLFSRFQPRTYELVEAISKLFANCGGQNNMPFYASGSALPAGFPERFIDYIYAQDNRKRFETNGIDFGFSHWAEVPSNQRAREMFCNAVTAFRDELLGLGVEQFNYYAFSGRTLNEQVRGVLQGDLMTDFRLARDAFNDLRQVLCSKILLSMVVEWLFQAEYEIEDVKALGGHANDYSRDKAVERAIFHKWNENNLARPVKRVNSEERNRFQLELTDNFELLLKTALARDDAVADLSTQLPVQLQSLASQLRADTEQKSILKAISGNAFGGDYHKAFIDASKIALVDVLCPALFQLPLLSENMLRQFFRQETMATYLTAVLLANDSQDAIRKAAEDNRELFQSKIDDTTQCIRDTGELHRRLLGSFIEILGTPEIQRRIEGGFRVLSEAHTILEHTPFGASGRASGAGRISAISPDPAYRESAALQRTEIREEDITDPLQKVIALEVERVVERVASDWHEPQGVHPAIASGADDPGDKQSRPEMRVGADSPTLKLNSELGSRAELPMHRSDIERSVENAVTGILSQIFPSGLPVALDESQFERVVTEATRQLTMAKGFLTGVKDDVRAFEQALYLIYRRYNENAEKHTFRNRVERLTLINMMLLFQNDLGFGQVSSSLYHLLLDLIQHLDPENPDPKAFLAEKSLTLYFDDAVLADGGITSLRKTLEIQTHSNLKSTLDFVSELQGIRYLFEAVSGDADAEIVVLNATASEFLDWLRLDNLSHENTARRRLVSSNLVTTLHRGQMSIQPGLVYLTDIAFAGTTKEQFLDRLAEFPMREGENVLLLPPICVSTAGAGYDWVKEGLELASHAQEAPTPIVIIGPAASINKSDDTFKTYLPAGYLFAAHFLCRPDQRIQTGINPAQSSGRFRVIGLGRASVRESLDRMVWGETQTGDYAFAADFFLYIILAAAAASICSGRITVGPNRFIDFVNDAGLNNSLSRPSPANRSLGAALIGGNAERFAIQLTGDLARLLSVTIDRGDKRVFTFHDVAWFNRAREKAGIL